MILQDVLGVFRYDFDEIDRVTGRSSGHVEFPRFSHEQLLEVQFVRILELPEIAI